MIVGFTGTQYGCTAEQRDSLRRYLRSLSPGMREFHHGGCIGADAQAHALVLRQCPIIIHPSNVEGKQANLRGAKLVLPEKLPLDRNNDIVRISNLMVGCPRHMFEEGRSGTWATLRESFRRSKSVTIVWPDGRVQKEATLESLPD